MRGTTETRRAWELRSRIACGTFTSAVAAPAEPAGGCSVVPNRRRKNELAFPDGGVWCCSAKALSQKQRSVVAPTKDIKI